MQPEDRALLTDIFESSREAVLYVGDRSGLELEQERMGYSRLSGSSKSSARPRTASPSSFVWRIRSCRGSK